MQTTLLPQSICDQIDKKIRSFIWGSTADARKLHLVHWEGICRPKAEGGLGIRKAKYFKSVGEGVTMKSIARASTLWRGIQRAWPIMMAGLHMGVKDGQLTKFWTDRWVDSGEMLLDHILEEAPAINPAQTVAEWTTPAGEWDVIRLRSYLPEMMVLQVIGVQPPTENAGADNTFWGPEHDGRFRVRTAYALACGFLETVSTFDYRTIWRWQGPARVSHFLWLAARERLLTNGERVRRHLTNSSRCDHCNDSPETVLHVLRDRSFSRLIWMRLIKPSEYQTFFSSHLQDWLLKNLRQQHTSLDFGITCWSLWKTRNDRVIAGKIITTEAFTQRILAWINVVRIAMDKDRLVHTPSLPTRKEVEISWKPPSLEWVTLNSDGSVLQSSGHAAAGGLIRDHTGRCLAAFAWNLGICSITRAELRGAVEGLQLAWDLGYRRVRVELNSRCAVLLLTSKDSDDHHHAAVINRFQGLLTHDWEVSISHVYREGNKCADFLANQGHLLPFGCHDFSVLDSGFRQHILYDCQGISTPRLVVNES